MKKGCSGGKDFSSFQQPRCALLDEQGNLCGTAMIVVGDAPVGGGLRGPKAVCPRHGGRAYIELWRGQRESVGEDLSR